jgi:hypothetical protein
MNYADLHSLTPGSVIVINCSPEQVEYRGGPAPNGTRGQFLWVDFTKSLPKIWVLLDGHSEPIRVAAYEIDIVTLAPTADETSTHDEPVSEFVRGWRAAVLHLANQSKQSETTVGA